MCFSEPSRWTGVAAHVVALTPLPSGLWRVLLVVGVGAGYTQAGYDDLVGADPVPLLLLSVVAELLGLLVFVLVRPWGERVPQWVPGVGGRTVPIAAVAVPAALGAGALSVLWTPFLGWWAVPHAGMTDTGIVVVGLLYLPLALWGPLLGLLTMIYVRRRRGTARVVGSRA